nr:MAG TPA: hypothetical protein [Bacteriophage sp.]
MVHCLSLDSVVNSYIYQVSVLWTFQYPTLSPLLARH